MHLVSFKSGGTEIILHNLRTPSANLDLDR
jgi:hypothetical protein